MTFNYCIESDVPQRGDLKELSTCLLLVKPASFISKTNFMKKLLVLQFLFVGSISLLAQKNVLPDTAIITTADINQFNRQKDNKDFYTRVTQFADLSWVSPPFLDHGSEKGWYILSADVSPHFFIGGERMPFVVGLTPRYRVRIFRNNEKFQDSSLPVRTPSFMPGLTVYIPLRRTAPDVFKNRNYISIAAFHHSNGQDGNTFKTNGEFNLSNGNFSTNYVEAGFIRNVRIKRSAANNKFNCEPEPEDCNQCPAQFPFGYYDHVAKIALEQHVGTAFAQRGSYSRTRLNLKYSFINVRNWRWLVGEGKPKKQIGRCFLKEHYRLIFNGSVNLDKLEEPYSKLSKRLNFDMGAYCRIASGNTAVFLMGGYYGNDPYNIFYSKDYFFIRGGLALGFFVHTSKLTD